MIDKRFTYHGRDLIKPLIRLNEKLLSNLEDYKNTAKAQPKQNDTATFFNGAATNHALTVKAFESSIAKCRNFLREARRTPKKAWDFDLDDLAWLYQFDSA